MQRDPLIVDDAAAALADQAMGAVAELDDTTAVHTPLAAQVTAMEVNAAVQAFAVQDNPAPEHASLLPNTAGHTGEMEANGVQVAAPQQLAAVTGGGQGTPTVTQAAAPQPLPAVNEAPDAAPAYKTVAQGSVMQVLAAEANDSAEMQNAVSDIQMLTAGIQEIETATM